MRDKRVLVVDDDVAVQHFVGLVLERGGYEWSGAASVEAAREALGRSGYAVVLLDIGMPGESGLELLGELSELLPEVAVVMITGRDDPGIAEGALALGAYGYVVKPFEPNELLINLASALRRRELEIESRERREQLEDMVRERTTELRQAVLDLAASRNSLRRSREETILRLGRAVESRDVETGQHIVRVSRLCQRLARRIGVEPSRCELLRIASQLHDVGKIGVPDGILLKRGTLTESEREIMQRHTVVGHEILSGSDSDLLELAATIAWTHHERFDGSGYPRSLAGEDIPLEGRITAVADVLDALTSDRTYRPAFPVDRALGMIQEARGTLFDPDIVAALFGSLDDVLELLEVGGTGNGHAAALGEPLRLTAELR